MSSHTDKPAAGAPTYRLCEKCGQPIKPGRHKLNEYDHAQGCPNDRSKKGKKP